MDAPSLDLLRSQRLAFLRAVYDTARGRTNAGFLQTALAAELGFDDELSDTIAQYLVDEGLLRWFTMGHLAITHAGIVEIESGIAHPNAPTEHFPPVVIAESYLHIGGSVIGSAIQQGTTGSTQSVSVHGLDAGGIRDVLGELRAALMGVDLPPEIENELEAEMTTIDVQVASPNPKSSILRECAGSVNGSPRARSARASRPKSRCS